MFKFPIIIIIKSQSCFLNSSKVLSQSLPLLHLRTDTEYYFLLSRTKVASALQIVLFYGSCLERFFRKNITSESQCSCYMSREKQGMGLVASAVHCLIGPSRVSVTEHQKNWSNVLTYFPREGWTYMISSMSLPCMLW